jgi:asparaginyl-tRNA synthetase
LKFTFETLLTKSHEDLAFFDERIEKGLVAKLQSIVSSEFVRMDYSEAISVLERAKEKFEFPVKWGIDLQSEHERYLTEKHVKRPVIVLNYPKEIKAYYMRVNDGGRTVAAMGVLAPGIGERLWRQPARGATRPAGHSDSRTRHRQGALRLVSRSAPLRHGSARRVWTRI